MLQKVQQIQNYDCKINNDQGGDLNHKSKSKSFCNDLKNDFWFKSFYPSDLFLIYDLNHFVWKIFLWFMQSLKIKWKLLYFENKSKWKLWKLPILIKAILQFCQFQKIAILEIVYFRKLQFWKLSIFNFVTSQNFFGNFVWKFSYELMTLCLRLSLIFNQNHYQQS